jgi:hypothetical protein
MTDYPKFYAHKNPNLPNRVANTPTDAVNLEARGYKVVDTKAAQKTADKVAPRTDAKSADAKA